MQLPCLISPLDFRQYLQAYDNDDDAESDYAWVYTYDESSAGDPLEAGTEIVDITGADGQEDEILASAITPSQTVGKDLVGLRARVGLHSMVVVLWWWA